MRISDWSSDVCSSDLWTIGLDYQATEDLFVYVTSRRGYRGANVNTPAFETVVTTGGPGCPQGACPDLRPFQKIGAEKLTDEELGAKWGREAGYESGRASRGERVCRYVYISGVAVY